MKKILKKMFGMNNSLEQQNGLGSKETAKYWTRHNVTTHYLFSDAKESLDYLYWRNDQYHNYIALMPLNGHDGKSILDFGCGPGHDLVGFGVYSKPSKLVGVDLSESSLKEAHYRLNIHGIEADLIQLSPDNSKLPFPNFTFDYIHSSGVLHHAPDPASILREFRRVLKPGGEIRIMVYNRDSLWFHLYVAYQRNIVQGLFSDKSLEEQFKRSTDGESCPISNCYSPNEWMKLCETIGFKVQFTGAAISMHEMTLLNLRFSAIQDRRLGTEHRKFLLGLMFDDKGYPFFNGNYAGIDACYRLSHHTS
jgi:ubiquinone/menaquinone biosynthesis C-methylase UbiE